MGVLSRGTLYEYPFVLESWGEGTTCSNWLFPCWLHDQWVRFPLRHPYRCSRHRRKRVVHSTSDHDVVSGHHHDCCCWQPLNNSWKRFTLTTTRTTITLT